MTINTNTKMSGSPYTINLSALSQSSGAIGSNYSNIFSLDTYDTVNKMHPDVKKYEVYESPTDILSLSVAWKRLRDAGTANGRIGRMLQKELFDELTTEDHQIASQIRDHYSKKIMMWNLVNTRLTDYRKDLSTFIHSDGTKFPENMIGLVYHLPTFYEYDIQIDDIRLQVSSDKDAVKLMQGTRNLKPLKRIVFKNKRNSNVQYWMQDIETGCAAMLSIDNKNPLEHIWNHVFESKKSLKIEASFGSKARDNFEYFTINKWSLSEI